MSVYSSCLWAICIVTITLETEVVQANHLQLMDYFFFTWGKLIGNINIYK